MTAKNAVADGRLSDELLGQMHRRMQEIVRRTDQGTLDPQRVLNELQRIIEDRRGHLFLAGLISIGKYDWINSKITESNFPMPAGFTLGTEPKIFHFARNISSENAIKQIKEILKEENGYRPATIWDLLDYGAKKPELQRKYPIVALGSIARVGGVRHVACLDGDDSGRDLDLGCFDDSWLDVYRFLAVRSPAQAGN